VVDGHDWPCLEARTVLSTAYRTDPDRLSRLMAVLMGRAADDLHVPAPASLHHRFVAWTRRRDDPCPVCGTLRHTVLAGVPPRLAGCERVRQLAGVQSGQAVEVPDPNERGRVPCQ